MPGQGQAVFIHTTTCAVGGGSGAIILTNVIIGGYSGTGYALNVTGKDDGLDYSTFGSTFPITADQLPNQEYSVYVEVSTSTDLISTEAEDITINCPGPGSNASCTIRAANLRPQAPTSQGGQGLLTFDILDAQTSAAFYEVLNGGVAVPGTSVAALGNGTFDVTGLVPGAGVSYALVVGESLPQPAPSTPIGCVQSYPFVIPDFVAPVLPQVPPPLAWHPVGGVLPNQALLAVPVVSLTTQAGLDRVGLFVEVELYRPGVPLAFATARRTIRTTSDSIDVSQYLRAQLQAEMDYPAYSGFFGDYSSGFTFTYRYREVDNLATGPWVAPLGLHLAVLAAMPPAAQDLLPFVLTEPNVAQPALAQWPVAFASGEATQFLGWPLEVALLLPERAETDAPVFIEASYFDVFGQVIERRTTPVDIENPAGYYRYTLPPDPLPCAARLELLVCNVNRSFIGTCDGSPGIPAGDGFLLTDTGFLRL